MNIKDRYTWAIQQAKSSYPGWDWELELVDFGETAKFAGRKGIVMTPILLLAVYPMGPIVDTFGLTTWLNTHCGKPVNYSTAPV